MVQNWKSATFVDRTGPLKIEKASYVRIEVKITHITCIIGNKWQ